MSFTFAMNAACRAGRGSLMTVADRTGPLEVLEGKRLLVMADCQNLDMSAKRLGHTVSYRTLRQKLMTVAASASLHAVFSRRPGDERRWHYFLKRGWIPHAKTTRLASKRSGGRPDANTDHLLAFLAGRLTGLFAIDLVVLATGDGQLVLDVAEAISQQPRPKPVATLSLAGSTSFRIDARRCPLVKWNLELGKDCLRPLGHRNPLRNPGTAESAHWCVPPGGAQPFQRTNPSAPHCAATRFKAHAPDCYGRRTDA
jgi:hypothetical protein